MNTTHKPETIRLGDAVRVRLFPQGEGFIYEVEHFANNSWFLIEDGNEWTREECIAMAHQAAFA